MSFLLTGSFNNFNIEGLKLNKFENIISYNFTLCKSEVHINLNENTNFDDNKEYYYICDCNGGDAFGHWVYEFFISYKNIIELNKLYPNIKLLTYNKKKYVKLFFNLFNINNEIIYMKNEDTITRNNVCFFSKIISLNDLHFNDVEDVKYYKQLVNDFAIEIDKKIPLLSDKNKILLLPRNNVDNFIPNDRIIHGIEDIKKNIINLGGTILDTYNLNNLYYQFTLIKNSEIIILDYGSSLCVNSIFLKNKKIIVLNNYNYDHNDSFLSLKILMDIVRMNNNDIIIVNSHNNRIEFANIEQFIV